jgi:alanine racemase
MRGWATSVVGRHAGLLFMFFLLVWALTLIFWHMNNSLIWVEISKTNVEHNIKTFRKIIGNDRLLCVAVKSNAYGHGSKEIAPVMQAAGVDWFGVNSINEAVELKESGLNAPIYIMGYIALDELHVAVANGFHFVVYNEETFLKLIEVCKETGKEAHTHLKLETGNFRQGVINGNLEKIIKIYKENPQIKLEGLATHFANIEDTTDHSYAKFQLESFKSMAEIIEKAGLRPKYKHCANSAATILFPQTYFNFVRVGVSSYGLWPSTETYISALQEKKEIVLKPVLTWKTKIAQIKHVPEGSYIGYGCTFKTTHDTKIAILPVGYYDGYIRKMSNCSYVIIHGKRAPVRGRVAMNMTMVDVTHIHDAEIEDEVILLGNQNGESITAEQLAECAETINYEITTHINGKIQRKVV